MLNALKSLWKLIVKALTMGTEKGSKMLDSTLSPLDQIDASIKQLRSSESAMKHLFFKLNKEVVTHSSRVKTQESELEAVQKNIKSALDAGNEERAKNYARSAMQKENLIALSKKRVTQLEERITGLQNRITRLTTDVTILKDQRVDMETVIAMRDDSQTMANGVEGINKSVSEIMKDAEEQIGNITHEDTAWQKVDEVFNSNDEAESTPDTSVDDYLKQFSK